MSKPCTLKHKKSIDNLREDLKEAGYTNNLAIGSDTSLRARKAHNEKIAEALPPIQAVINAWERGLRQEGILREGESILEDKLVKPYPGDIDSRISFTRNILTVNIDESILKRLDDKRKSLGIYESKQSLSDYRKKQREQQQQVSELFESNPELANEIYEALGLIDEAGFKETSKYEMSLGEAKFTGVEPFTEKEQAEIDRLNALQKATAQQLYSQYLEQNPNGNIEGFRNWIDSNKPQLQKDRKDDLRVANLEYLEEVLNTLSNKFGLPYEIIFDENNPNKGYVDVISYKQPTIIINASKATSDTPLHEYGHIFINLIKSSNKNLYSTLVKEVLNTEQGKKELKAVQEHYVDYTLEEQIEETIVQLLGEYAAGNLDSKTGLHKTIKKIWNSILEFLSKAFNVEIKDISPNTSIESLAKLLANPNINFNQKSFIEKNIESIRKEDLKRKERLEKEYLDFQKIKDPSVIKEDDFTIVVNSTEYELFNKELELLIKSLKKYSREQLNIDIKNIRPQIETFEQRENFNYDRYPLFTKILPFIHPNKDTALWVLNNADNLEDRIKEVSEILDRPLDKIKKDIINGYGFSKSLEINIPDFYKLPYKNDNINSVKDIEDGFKNKLSELDDIIENPEKSESYYSRAIKVQIDDDTYSIRGSFSNGNISISFSSEKYAMNDANKGLFFKVLPKVIDSISYMFSDVEYNTISFLPVHGESSKGRDLRLKGYNIFAKRLFGQFSLVAENENTTIIPVPDAFKNRVHIKENMYQKDRDNVSGNSFQQSNNTVQDLSGNTYSVNESDIITYETEVGPIRYIINENGDMVMLSDKNTGAVGDQIAPQSQVSQYSPGINNENSLNSPIFEPQVKIVKLNCQ